MEGDMNIYGDAGRSLVGSLIGYLVGLFAIVGGFIFAARYLIGKRVERFEREWRASHGTNGEDDAPPPPPDEPKPPSSW